MLSNFIYFFSHSIDFCVLYRMLSFRFFQDLHMFPCTTIIGIIFPKVPTTKYCKQFTLKLVLHFMCCIEISICHCSTSQLALFYTLIYLSFLRATVLQFFDYLSTSLIFVVKYLNQDTLYGYYMCVKIISLAIKLAYKAAHSISLRKFHVESFSQYQQPVSYGQGQHLFNELPVILEFFLLGANPRN